MPNLVVGVLMLRLVSFAKPYMEKQLVVDVIWGLKCSTGLYCSSGAVVGIIEEKKRSGPNFYSCSTLIGSTFLVTHVSCILNEKDRKRDRLNKIIGCKLA